MMRRLESLSDGLNRTLRPAAGGAPTVRWIERTQRGQHVALSAVPLDLAPVLRQLLFDRLQTVVLTSATLAAGGDFGFLETRLGLGGDASPVSVREILAVTVRLSVAVRLRGAQRFSRAPRTTSRARSRRRPGRVRTWPMRRTAGCSCSSPAMPRCAGPPVSCGRCWETAGPSWSRAKRPGTPCFGGFREAENAILLGTDSFWEGVDVPGRALRALVLNKLPFKVPSEPVTAARLERLAEEGLDGFWHYLLPHAALKLKQGFGRLIRSRQDVGIVVLLDSRVVTKRYGPLLLKRPAPGRAGHRQLGSGPHQVRRLLRSARYRSRRYEPVRPSKIIGIGRNYLAHAKELGNRDAPGADHLLQAAHRLDRRR